MRRIKIILVLLLIFVSVIYGFNFIQNKLSGVDVGPAIECTQDLLEVSVYDDESTLLAGVSASDKQDGDLTSQILVSGVSQLITDDTAKVTYIVFDSDDNMASCVRQIRYTDYQRPTIQVTGALNFAANETEKVLNNLTASDVIDGDISDSIRISMLRATDDSNVRSVGVQVTNSMGDTTSLELPVIVMDSDPARPVIELTDYLVYLEQGSKFSAKSYIDSVTVHANTVDNSNVLIDDPVDTDVPGTYWVYYSYTSGNKTGMAILTVVVQ